MIDPDEPPQAALVSGDAELIDHVADAAAAAGFTLQTITDPASAMIGGARAILVGVDKATELVRAGVPRHGEALVVGSDGQLAQLWQVASDLGTPGAVSLPSGGAWLVRWLHGRAGGKSRRECAVSAVFSAAGGVGASTLSAALAVTASSCGLQPLLIDAHPGPAGVELLLGDPSTADQWSRFAAIRGYLPSDALDSLPVLEGVRCLGWGGGREVQLWEGALGSVLSAARRDHDLVVIDAGLHPGLCPDLPRRTRPILVVPASWRGVMAAQSRLTVLRQAFDETPIVVLRDVGGRNDPRSWVNDFGGCQVLVLEFDASVIDDEEQCRPPGTRPRSEVGKVSRRLLAALAQASAAA